MRYIYITIGEIVFSLILFLCHVTYLKLVIGGINYEGGLLGMATLTAATNLVTIAICCVVEFIFTALYGRANIKQWMIFFLVIGALSSIYYSSYLVVPLILVEYGLNASLEVAMNTVRVISVLSVVTLFVASIKHRNKNLPESTLYK